MSRPPMAPFMSHGVTGHFVAAFEPVVTTPGAGQQIERVAKELLPGAAARAGDQYVGAPNSPQFMPSVAVDRVASVAAEEEIVAASSVLADKIGIADQRVVAIASRKCDRCPQAQKGCPPGPRRWCWPWFGWSTICASSPVVPTIVAMGASPKKFVRPRRRRGGRDRGTVVRHQRYIDRWPVSQSMVRHKCPQTRIVEADLRRTASNHGGLFTAAIHGQHRAACRGTERDRPMSFIYCLTGDNYIRRRAGHRLLGLLLRAVYGRLAGYEDMYGAERPGRDPAMRAIVGREGLDRPAASTSEMGRSRPRGRSATPTLAALTNLSGAWIDRVHGDYRSRISPGRSICAACPVARVVVEPVELRETHGL